MLVRPATVDDAPAIVALLNPILALGLSSLRGPLSAEDVVALLEGLPEDAVYLAAVEGDQIVGVQDLYPSGWEEAEISTFVRIGHQGRGVGKRLFEAIQPHAEASGAKILWATFRPHNAGALTFYSRLGFEITGIEASRVRARWTVVPQGPVASEPSGS